MTITKKALPRRTMLRGAATMLALPLLDAMVPAFTALAQTPAGRPPTRMGFFYVPNGMYMPNFYPKQEGPLTAEMTPILAPLAKVRDSVVVFSQLANAEADARDIGAAPHTRCAATWLSGARPKHTEGIDIYLGTTLDQYAAKVLGQDTPLTSLEIALEPNYIVGNCSGGYSCTYVNSASWRTPTQPLPMENNPRAVFERLFGYEGDKPTRARHMRIDRSILDSVGDEMKKLQAGLGAQDRLTVDQYADAVRDVERRIQKAERQSETTDMSMELPIGIPASFEEHAKLMTDMQLLAYRADITRVVTFQIAREQSERTYPNIGVEEGHHPTSHHNNSPEKILQNSKINAYQIQVTAQLAEQMANTPDGDGSLLDHSILYHGGGMGDGNLHSPHDLPLVLIGGAGGLKGGRHLRAKLDTPIMNVGLTLLHKVGIDVDKVGDSTGEVPGL